MLKPLFRVALVVGSLSYVGQARATVLWKGDFETGDLSQWDSTLLIKTGDRDNLVLEGDSVADGKKAAKITLRDDIIFEPYNQSRVEVKHVGLHTNDGEDSYYAWSFMVPKDAEIRSNIGYWESTPTSKNTMTFFIEPASGGGTNVKFGTGDLGQTLRWTAKLELNKWHRMAIHNHWSQDPAVGKADVWYDGTQVVNGASVAKRDGNKLFFQMGLHRSDPSPPVQDIYIDAAVEADSQADILQPLPDPMGSGGAAGSGGSASGGASSGGAGGSAGSGAEPSSSGGMPLAVGGQGGALGGTGTQLSGGTSGSGQTGGVAVGGASNSPGTVRDSGGCSVAAPHGRLRDAWPILGWLLLGRRKRRASPRA